MGNINREDPDFDHYTTQDRTARSILSGLIGIVTISHIMRRQKNTAPSLPKNLQQ